MDRDDSLRRDIVAIGRRMYAKGMIAAADGNVSARTDDGRVYITPSGRCKGYLEAAEIVVTDLEGKPFGDDARPSSEIDMHLAIYEVRTDVRSICHAHPPLATGFAAAGVALSPALLSEIVLTLGCVPLTPYATPTTTELADTARKWATSHDGLLLANHGAVTLGADPYDAFYKMDTIEHYARINLVTKILGSERPLPSEAVSKLMDLRRQAGLTDNDPYCGLTTAAAPKPAPAPTPAADPGDDDEPITLTRRELVALVESALAAGGR